MSKEDIHSVRFQNLSVRGAVLCAQRGRGGREGAHRSAEESGGAAKRCNDLITFYVFTFLIPITPSCDDGDGGDDDDACDASRPSPSWWESSASRRRPSPTSG